MDNKNTLITKFTDLLFDMNFDQRYYAYFEAQRGIETDLSPTEVRTITENALKEWGVEAKYDSKEKFFRFEEQVGEYKFVSTIAFSYFSKLELLFAVHTASESAGGALHWLARNIARQRTPNFEYSPRYPRIPFGNADGLNEAIQFSMALFGEFKQAIQNEDAVGDSE